MNELRWHPFLRQWVVMATHRQERPQMPADWCPFCPGSGRVPASYSVLLYPNDFAALQPGAEPFDPKPGFSRATGARGACDVVLYSPQHTLPPSQLTSAQWGEVIAVWKQRTLQHAATPEIAYVMIFENTGEAIGVTMPHPHGQIYGFPFVPPLVEQELEGARDYHKTAGKCLHCDVLERERAEGVRLVGENSQFVAFVPYAARFPSEVHLYAKRHCQALPDLTTDEEQELAEMISAVRRKYDALYGFPLPLMMVVRQAPLRGEHGYFHFHLQFLPLQRSRTKLKYLAAVESGAGTFLADTLPEERAAELRKMPPELAGLSTR